jgi:hypothetical protein
MRVTGGCLCGAIEGNGAPQFQVTCYCADCQRMSGATMGFAGGAIHVTPGAREFASKADNGNDIAPSVRSAARASIPGTPPCRT